MSVHTLAYLELFAGIFIRLIGVQLPCCCLLVNGFMQLFRLCSAARQMSCCRGLSAESDSKASSYTLAVVLHNLNHAEHHLCCAHGRWQPAPVHPCSCAACAAWTQFQDCHQCQHLLLVLRSPLHLRTDYC